MLPQIILDGEPLPNEPPAGPAVGRSAELQQVEQLARKTGMLATHVHRQVLANRDDQIRKLLQEMSLTPSETYASMLEQIRQHFLGNKEHA